MNEDEILQKVRKFVGAFAGISEGKIDADSRLENDLKIYGDDTMDLVKSYSKRFGVDIKNFKPDNYIGPEGDTILITLLGNGKMLPEEVI